MSIIGTRPPLISETNLYELHHKEQRIYAGKIIYNREQQLEIVKGLIDYFLCFDMVQG